jgi:hypothetical protein
MREGPKKIIVGTWDTLAITVQSRFEIYSFFNLIGTLSSDFKYFWTTYDEVKFLDVLY